MNVTEFKQEIINSRMDEEELLDLNRFIVDELKEARRRIARKTVAALRAGDRVKVTGRLRGDAYYGVEGTVLKVNRTRVLCDFGDSREVFIPASVLTQVT